MQQTHHIVTNSHNWCCSCICTLPILAFDETKRSLCLFALTTSLARIRADFTSFFFARVLSSDRDFCVALSSWSQRCSAVRGLGCYARA